MNIARDLCQHPTVGSHKKAQKDFRNLSVLFCLFEALLAFAAYQVSRRDRLRHTPESVDAL